MRLLKSFVGQMQSRHSECKAIFRMIADHDAKMEELKLGLYLLEDETGNVGEYSKRLNTQKGQLDSTRQTTVAREGVFKAGIYSLVTKGIN